MPTFATPKPINVEIDLMVANVTITAEDRADTVVNVDPTNPDNASDVEAAAETRVELSGDTMTVKGPGFRKYVGWSNKSRSVDVSITMPTGSSVFGSGVGAVINLKATGRLGRCEFRSGVGHVHLNQAGSVKLKVFGDILVDEVDGDAKLSTSTGQLRIGQVTGTVDAKNSNGSVVIGDIGGSARLRSSNGDIVVDRALGDVDAVTAHGNIRVDEVRQGVVELKTAMGEIQLGVAEGTAAWLDAHTSFGTVRKQLDGAGEPGPGESTVKVRARSSYGDIVIRRS
ncbi:DUF4097 family beta strand repeat-containing protein [Stackebrandtia soli]|uniref:DUF4097 family beta strand repeat-containing protein n=1 Tax=Stackebrandtia soli TaxID=1892856 RepID=UPI0039E8885E